MAVPFVTSMCTLKGFIMSIPIRQGGDSSPMMTIKLAHPRASPHWISKCSVLPAMFKGLPWAQWDHTIKLLKSSPLGAVAPPDSES